MALCSLPRFMAVLVLATAAILQAPQVAATTSSYVNVCEEENLACAEDTVCSACRETASSNTEAFEQCFANYVHEASTCVNQAAQPCCQAEASSTDCLANDFYVAYYDCRLINDVVDEECPGLSCAAVGTAAPTPVGGVVEPTMSPTVVDEEPEVPNWAARTVPLGAKTIAVAAVFATAGLLMALPAAAFV